MNSTPPGSGRRPPGSDRPDRPSRPDRPGRPAGRSDGRSGSRPADRGSRKGTSRRDGSRKPGPPPAPEAGTSAFVLHQLKAVDAAVRAGHRSDRTLSRIFQEHSLPPDQRRRLLRLSQAWFRWSGVMPADMEFSERLCWCAAMEGLPLPGHKPRGLTQPEWNSWTLPPVSRRLDWLGLQLMELRGIRAESLLPAWITEALPTDRDRHALAEALLMPPGLWIRSRVDVHALRAGLEAHVEVLRMHPDLKGCWAVRSEADLYYMESYQRGDFVIQDPASQAIGLLCGALPGERWWDMCAGAGGKTLQLCDSMGGKGVVIATDTHEQRLKELRRRLALAGRHNLEVHLWTGDRPPKGPAFDGVLVDAPCSNSGTLRRNPDLWRREGIQLDELRELQSRLLNLAAPRVKPGGRLVYATCSLLPCENEEVVALFRQRFPEFKPVSLQDPLDGRGESQGAIRFDPEVGDHDGTFVAVLRKDEAAD
ncbi:MAG: RsmB/NOP family class I SAM-dependent RNA methyltransferase [Calditrichaeota bacterium]|nr:RsmB/NOP family class I SAM-dependent RNA methyltransferase [Candidatus Cloacimonadota bacterium]MCA9786356.1 RsmB/NOP family class I SAM-dependent RNA methyltransferase [Candidatus Cloacimonadota bacterium]MCB1046971.1 RsmB/NOP family class I SAM-dependent RNA methyltransferase [Calditrichota bacterium]MCB9474401.1 RsmB/NOP family class I SAM-dependent RNA methyltransferase [Candidatus Delongbacteria bacterium]